MFADDGSGIWTGHSRVACLRSVMFGVSAGKMWMAASDSKSWEPESSGGFFTHTPGTWAKLGPSREQWHVACPRGSGFSQHGTGSKKKHLERALRENQRRSCLVFTDLVSHVTKHLSLCWLKQLPACPDVRKEAPSISGIMSKKLKSYFKKPHLTGIWLTTCQIYQVL